MVITCLLASKLLGMFSAGFANYSTLLVLLLLATFELTLSTWRWQACACSIDWSLWQPSR